MKTPDHKFLGEYFNIIWGFIRAHMYEILLVSLTQILLGRLKVELCFIDIPIYLKSYTLCQSD